MLMSNTFPEKINTLISYWATQDLINLNEGASDDSILELEKDVGFTFEEDFKTYLKTANGFQNFDSDDHWISFWSIDRIREELNDHHPKELICFSDYSINLCSFGFHRKNKKVYIHYQTIEGFKFLADSFHEFIDLYLDNPDQKIII